MMGRQDDCQQALFYKFSLEDHIPADHNLRKVNEVLDLADIRKTLAPHYSPIGRPSIDPELMLRMLIIGYLYGIRSERRLCEEVHVNLAYRWFCRLGLQGKVPERSVFSKTRHGRFRDGNVFRELFQTVLGSCMKAGLVGGESFAIDASTIEADASIDRRAEGATRPDHWSEEAVTRPIREYLDVLDRDAGFTVMEGTQLQPAKALSLTDPAASFRHRPKGSACFGYSTNYLIDRQNAVIVDVEATPARISTEVASTITMLERAEKRFGLTPKNIAADMAYGTGRLLHWLLGKGIEPHIPVFDNKSYVPGQFTRADFTYDKERDVYICPNGRILHCTGKIQSNGIWIYLARRQDCMNCLLKARCTAYERRKLGVSLHEDARDYTRKLADTDAYKTSRRERKKVEMLFAHLKRNMNFRRLRLRGPSGAHDEFLLAAIAQNIKKLIRFMATPPPLLAARGALPAQNR